MKIIIITSPSFIEEEVFLIPRLLEWGVSTIHLRKPQSSYKDCSGLLNNIPKSLHKNIVIHDHFSLTKEFDLQGIHLNSRNNTPPIDFNGTISCSCHSIDEIEKAKPNFDYVFLSPIFDSISKPGYRSAFTSETLYTAARQGIIDNKVIALGGINVKNFHVLSRYGFGGAAILGDIWNNIHKKDLRSHIKQFLL